MAYFTVRLFANSLRRRTTFEMFIPNDIREDIPHEEKKGKIKTLFLRLYGGRGKLGTRIYCGKI